MECVCADQLLLRMGPALECSINHNRDRASDMPLEKTDFLFLRRYQLWIASWLGVGSCLYFFSALGLWLAGGYVGHVCIATISVHMCVSAVVSGWCCLTLTTFLPALPLESWVFGEGLDGDTSFKTQLSKPLTLHIAWLWGVYVNSHPLKGEAFLMSRCH